MGRHDHDPPWQLTTLYKFRAILKKSRPAVLRPYTLRLHTVFCTHNSARGLLKGAQKGGQGGATLRGTLSNSAALLGAATHNTPQVSTGTKKKERDKKKNFDEIYVYGRLIVKILDPLEREK